MTETLGEPNQGRRTLGEVMAQMKTNTVKRLVLQMLAGMYAWKALLFQSGLTPSPAYTHCGHAAETKTHIQCAWLSHLQSAHLTDSETLETLSQMA